MAGGLLFSLVAARALPHAIDLPQVGTRYVQASRLLPGQPVRAGTGYDGQFTFVLAEDPWLRDADTARSLDNTFRVRRALLPIAGWVLSLGRRTAVPYSLLAINWLAGLALATLLARAAWVRGRSPWLALLAVAYPGAWLPLLQDTTEPLQNALLVAGLETSSLGLLALATLAKETAGVALVTEAMRAAGARQWGRAAAAAGLAAAYIGFAVAVFALVRGPAFNTLGAHFLDPPGAPLIELARGGARAALVAPAVVVVVVAAVRPLLGARDAAGLAACAYALLTLAAGTDTWSDPAAYYRVTAGAAVLLLLSWLDRRDRLGGSALILGAAAGLAIGLATLSP